MKSKIIIRYLIFLAVFLIGKEGIAQHPPIFTDTPLLMGLSARAVRTFGKFVSKENANIYIQPLAIPFNPSSTSVIGAIAPFVRKSPKGKKSQSGIGDVSIFFKQMFYKRDGKGKTFRILGMIKQKFPTGNTSETPAIGSGSYQTTLGLVGGYITTKYSIFNEIGYNFASNGISDHFIYNFAFGYPILPPQYPPRQLNVYLEFIGKYFVENKQNSLFIAPGIQLIPGRRLTIETGIQFALIEDVPDSQKTNYIFVLGTRILIF